MSDGIVDLDDMETWPDEVREQLSRNLDGLVAEYAAQRDFDLSGDRWSQTSPSKLLTDSAHELITEHMGRERLRVFHATRLLDCNEVRVGGLRPLALDERIQKLRDLAAQGRLPGFNGQIDEVIGRVDLTDRFFTIREQLVWATPMRRYLHDGGCDVFFEHWGGEAVQRLAAMACPELETAIQNIGKAAVVVVNIPALGCCKAADWRLPPTMLELALEASGQIDVAIGAWDVRTAQAIPADWIEDIVPPSDAKLADDRPR